MHAVRVVFQCCVDPVGEGDFLFLCRSQASISMTPKRTETIAINLQATRASVPPENECCVPSLESSDVPPMARMPSFLLRTFRKVFATSLPLRSWTI